MFKIEVLKDGISMIVVGYQGVGKSTLAGRDNKFIDLESGNFWVDGKRAEDWYKPYCKIAEHLSQQGYIVFVSSHEVVRKQLEDTKETIVVVYPSLKLKNEWLTKLEERYDRSGLEKDYKALMNAEYKYEENIKELSKSPFNLLELDNMYYDLESELIAFKNQMNNL